MRGIASTASASVIVELSVDGGVGIVFVLGQSLDLSAGTPAIAPWISWDRLLPFEGVAVESADRGPHRRTPSRATAGSGEHHLPLLVFRHSLGTVCGFADI
jgi:hypothetical protein